MAGVAVLRDTLAATTRVRTNVGVDTARARIFLTTRMALRPATPTIDLHVT